MLSLHAYAYDALPTGQWVPANKTSNLHFDGEAFISTSNDWKPAVVCWLPNMHVAIWLKVSSVQGSCVIQISLWNPFSNICCFRGSNTMLPCKGKVKTQQKYWLFDAKHVPLKKRGQNYTFVLLLMFRSYFGPVGKNVVSFRQESVSVRVSWQYQILDDTKFHCI